MWIIQPFNILRGERNVLPVEGPADRPFTIAGCPSLSGVAWMIRSRLLYQDHPAVKWTLINVSKSMKI